MGRVTPSALEVVNNEERARRMERRARFRSVSGNFLE